MDNYKKKVTSNLLWRFAERCGAQGMALIVSIILARLLSPDAYGQLALITVITSLLQVFVDSGMANALIQKKETDQLDYSSVFYFNMVFCLLLYGGLFFLAPVIARGYKNEALTAVIRVLGLTVILSGLTNVQQAYVSKTLQFKRFFFATLCGSAAGAVTGIAMACSGYELWALVGQRLVNLLVNCVVLWFTVEWRPIWAFSWDRLKGLISYGWKLLVSSLLDTAYTKGWQLIIGLRYTDADLAYYNHGEQFPNLIVSNINASIDSVLLPVLSEQQDEKDRVRDMTRRAIRTGTYIIMPMMMGLAACASSLVSIILTDKWLPAVPFLRIFCITYMFFPLHTANLNAVKAMGRSDTFLKLDVLKKLLGLCLLLLTMRLGVMAMACSLLVNSLFSQLINAWPNKKLLGYAYPQQIRDILPALLLSLGMGGAVYAVELLGLGSWPTLLIQVPLGVLLYVLGSKLCRLESYEYLLAAIKAMTGKGRK